MVAHDALELVLGYGVEAQRLGVVVECEQLLSQDHRVIEEPGIVRTEEQLLQGNEEGLRLVEEGETAPSG